MKIIEQWLLYEYIGLEFTPLSRPFKTEEQAEKGAFETTGAGTAEGCGGSDSS